MSDTSTSGETPSGAPAATAGAPTAPAADWGTASGATRGSGLARGKRVSPPASPAPASNTAVTGAYQPSAVQVLKAETEYQNPFAPANEAPSVPAPEVTPAPAAVAPIAPVVAKPAEAPAPAPVAPVAAVVEPTAPAPKAELNILPPAEVKRPAQSWETPAFPYEGNHTPAPASAKPQTSAAPRADSPLRSERPVFRPERRSEVPMLERAPDASGNAPRADSRGGQRPGRGGRDGNRQQPRDGRSQQQPRDRGNRPAGNAPAGPGAPIAPGAPVSGGRPSKKPAGLFGWVKGLFGTTAPEIGKPSLPGAPSQPAAGGGERGPDGNRRRRRRGGRGRSGGGGPQGGPSGPQGVNPTQSHGQGHPSHGHGGGEHRPQGQGGGRRRRGGRGRSGGGGGQGGAPGGGHRHEGGGSGIPPSA
ncbi:MAG: translation initiation factor [Rariglobus sp.]|nr:translation initiation factor [Rariglobus sp.]